MPDSNAAQHAIGQPAESRANARADGRIESAYGQVERAALVAAADHHAGHRRRLRLAVHQQRNAPG